MASKISLATKDTKWPNNISVYYPNSDEFVDKTARWNGYGSARYGAAVSPSSENEIAGIVRISLSSPLPPSPPKHALG